MTNEEGRKAALEDLADVKDLIPHLARVVAAMERIDNRRAQCPAEMRSMAQEAVAAIVRDDLKNLLGVFKRSARDIEQITGRWS